MKSAPDPRHVRAIYLDTCPSDCCWRHPAIEAAAERAIGDVVDADWWEQETKKRTRREGR